MRNRLNLLNVITKILINSFKELIKKFQNHLFIKKLTLFFKLALNLFLKFKSKYIKNNILILGRDYVNWSIDKDRKNTEYFLKLNGFNITDNIIKATHIFCVWADLLASSDFMWVNILKKILKFKVIATVTNDISFYKNKITYLKNYIDIWIAPSHKIYFFLKKIGVQVYLIPFYVSIKKFYHLNKNKKEICNALNLDYSKLKNKIIIGSFQRDTISSLDKPKWQKNPDLLIQILEKIPKNLFILLLTGPRRHYIISECEKHDIPYIYYGNYKFIKEIKDDIVINNYPEKIINLLYNLCDIYIVSSKIEGGPKAILEASLTKTLIFSTDVGLAKDFLNKDLIFSEDNFSKIEKIINKFDLHQEEIKEYISFNYSQVKKIISENNYRIRYKKMLNQI